jgi:glycosyltransferase involved in cell wall biosynthesis
MAEQALRVAIVEAYSEVVGGSHVIWREVARAGRESGRWEATVFLPSDGTAARWLRASNVAVEVVPAPDALLRFGGSWRSSVPAILTALPQYWQTISRALRDADVVHVSDLRGVVLTGPLLLLRRRAALLHVHNGEAGGVAWRLLVAVLMMRGRTVVVPSRGGAAGWAGKRRERLVELPNPVAAVPARVEGAEPLVVTIARLHEDKGIEVLLDAMELLNQRNVAARLVVVGPDAPGQDQVAAGLRRRAATLSNVELCGPLDDPSSALAAAWVYAQPSRREPFGLAALEASARGLPVVATRVGGLPDVVADGTTGLLVPPGDPSALAETLARLLASTEERARMGEAGRQRARNDFSPERFAGRLADVYAGVVA